MWRRPCRRSARDAQTNGTTWVARPAVVAMEFCSHDGFRETLDGRSQVGQHVTRTNERTLRLDGWLPRPLSASDYGRRCKAGPACRWCVDVRGRSAVLPIENFRAIETQWELLVKSPILKACLALGLAALSGCSQPVNCSGGNYGGGCYPGPT